MVTADEQEAAGALEQGEAVVLIVGHGAGVGRDAPTAEARPGRLAVLVGAADDPAAWAAARAMELELFPDGPRSGR